jgi:hypothetical protein
LAREWLRTEVVRIVVVKDEYGTEISIVTAGMTEIEGASAHQRRQRDAEQPRQPPVTSRAEGQPRPTVAAGA